MVTTTWPPGSTDAESKLRLALGVACAAAGKMSNMHSIPAMAATIVAANTLFSNKLFLFCYVMFWEGAPLRGNPLPLLDWAPT